jgi:hypothetical protein
MASTPYDESRLARVEERQDVLIRGLTQMNETLALHTAMLERLLVAATEEPAASDLPDALRRMAEALTAQESALVRLDERLATLPDAIAEAIAATP